jgi:GNAT superfamily N-acetyltransferase
VPKVPNLADSNDKDIFMELWKEAVESQSRMGSSIVPSAKTMNFFSGIFDAYTSGELEGVCLFGASKNAVLLWGEMGSELPWDSTMGKWAMGWGTYIRPAYRRQGVARLLRDEAMKYLYEMGIETVIGTSVSGNVAGEESMASYKADVSGIEWRMKVIDHVDFQCTVGVRK